MKKRILSILLALLIGMTGIKPASALMLDFASMAGVVSKVSGTISEYTNKIVEGVNKIKQISAQGFSFDQLLDSAKSYGLQYGKAYIQGQIKGAQKTRVESTQQKALELLEAQRDAYQQGVKKEYEVKLEIADKEIAIIKEEIRTARAELLKPNLSESEIKTLGNKIIGLEAELEILERKREDLYKESQRVGTMEDPRFKAMQERVDATGAEQDKTDLIEPDEDGQDVDWANMDSMENYKLEEEDYQEFVKNYFYDESNIEEATKEQAKRDRVDRNTRYLLINTAVHLLQVSSTTRREVPQRTSQADEMFQQTKKGSGEKEAMMAYASVDIEKTKALWLYAKLLSAKLQYMAAHDLSRINKKKKTAGKKYKEFDLGKYILTEEYVKEIDNESNQTLGLDKIEPEMKD